MRKNEYWFVPYDLEFNRKNYNQINFQKYETLIRQLPKFKEIPVEYPLSTQPLEQDLQINAANIIGEMISFFQPNNPDIYSNDQQWIDFVVRSQLFVNCEKFYCLMFWRFKTSNQFILKRIWAFYVRFLKFLEAFQQAVYKLDGHRKSKSIEDCKDYLHVKLPGLKRFLENVKQEIDLVIDSNIKDNKPNLQNSQNSFKYQNFYYQNLLFETIRNIIINFTRYPYIKLVEFIQAKEINYIYQQVLDSNDESSKVLDTMLNKFEKQNQQPVEEKFETPFLKSLVGGQQKRFQPIEADRSQLNFLEKLDNKISKTKSSNSDLNTTLQTNRIYTTQSSTQTSVHTEATDDTIVGDELEDINNSSIAKSLMNKYSQGVTTSVQNKQFAEVSVYKESPNFPNIQRNPMMEFINPEVYQYIQSTTKQKQSLQNDLNHKMKFGNESKKDIEKALKKKNENQNTINDMHEEAYEDDSGAENYDDEEEEQEDNDYQNNNDQNNNLYSKYFEIGDKLIQEVNAADEKLVQIQDKDIDFDQNKTKVPQIKKTDDVSGTANKYKAQSNIDLQYQLSDNSNQLDNMQNANIDDQSNEDIEDENEKPDPFETPQKEHFDEAANDIKDDDIFDYSYEKDEEDDDESDINNSQNDYDSGNEDNDSIDDMNRQSVVEKEKVKLRVPFTQFKSQIENSFIQFLKESLYSQENEQDTNIQETVEQSSQNLQKKKKNKVPLKVIFPDIRVVHIIGMNFAPYYSECYWMLQRMKIQDKILLKRTARIQKYFKYAMSVQVDQERRQGSSQNEVLIAPPILNRKRLNACEQKQINY